ncbi:hypothetical protein [Sphingomonas morindae]|uniref:Flp pilus assembly protein CpaB n=1 Tax=Sphingomonas morindae TaxID=1541170 RepID=A0ABY4X5N8_9SPHN|nr:hypothetical protein [Sphingomonas morindae]USI72196.1 hypothetical protein LHA26_12920 [Sphingomonas morindae]
MSRATIILLILLIAIVGGLVALSRRSAEVPPHRIEKVVTLNGDAAKQ